MAALNVTPVGSVSLLFSLSVGVGTPLAVTVKLPAVPTVKVVWSALVKAGAWLTVPVTLTLSMAIPALLRYQAWVEEYWNLIWVSELSVRPRLVAIWLRLKLKAWYDWLAVWVMSMFDSSYQVLPSTLKETPV